MKHFIPDTIFKGATDVGSPKPELDRTKGKILFGAPFRGRVTPEMWNALKSSEEDYRLSDPENYDKFANKWKSLNSSVDEFYSVQKKHGKRAAKSFWKTTPWSHTMPGGVGVGYAGKKTGHNTGTELDLAFGASKDPGKQGGMKFPSGLLAAFNRNNVYSASKDPGHRHHLYLKTPDTSAPKWKQRQTHRGKIRSQVQLYPRDTRGDEGMASKTHVRGSDMPVTKDRPTPIPPRSRRTAQRYGVPGYESKTAGRSIPIQSSREIPSPPSAGGHPWSTGDARTSSAQLDAPRPPSQSLATRHVVSKPGYGKVNKSISFTSELFIEE